MVDRRTNLSEEEIARRKHSRWQTEVMKEYLDGLVMTAPQRGQGRKKSPQQRIDEATAALETETDNLAKVLLTQQLRDAEEEQRMQDSVNMQAREAAFVEQVAAYSKRRGVSYKTWREYGVPAKVLRAGGLNHRN